MDVRQLEDVKGMVSTDSMCWWTTWFTLTSPSNVLEATFVGSPWVWSTFSNHIPGENEGQTALTKFARQWFPKQEENISSVLLPVCQYEHWSLLIMTKEHFYHLDSLRSEHGLHKHLKMKTYMARLWSISQGIQLNSSLWKQMVRRQWEKPEVPQQHSNWECGYFTMQYIEKYCKDVAGSQCPAQVQIPDRLSEKIVFWHCFPLLQCPVVVTYVLSYLASV